MRQQTPALDRETGLSLELECLKWCVVRCGAVSTNSMRINYQELLSTKIHATVRNKDQTPKLGTSSIQSLDHRAEACR